MPDAKSQLQSPQKPQSDQPGHQPEGKGIEVDSDSAMQQMLMRQLSGTGASGDEPTGGSHGASTQQQRAMLQMQRQYGNAAIQRKMASVQRNAPPVPGVANGFKIVTPEKELKVDRSLGRIPLKLSKIKIGGEIAGNVTPKGGDDTKGVNALSKEGAPGVHGEVSKTWDTFSAGILGEATVQSKTEGEISTKGGEISLTVLGVKTKNLGIGLKFTIVSYSAEKSEIQFAVLSVPLDIVPIADSFISKDGDKVSYEIKAVITFEFELDKARVAEYLAEQFAKQATAELAIAGAFIIGGIATIAAGIVTASLGGEVRERVEGAIKGTNDFCAAYAAVLKGQDFAGDTAFGAKGKSVGDEFMKKADLPPEAIREKAKERNLRAEAFEVGWPIVKEAMLKDYRDDHYVEWYVYGEAGPGYRILKRLLDSPQHLNF